MAKRSMARPSEMRPQLRQQVTAAVMHRHTFLLRLGSTTPAPQIVAWSNAIGARLVDHCDSRTKSALARSEEGEVEMDGGQMCRRSMGAKLVGWEEAP